MAKATFGAAAGIKVDQAAMIDCRCPKCECRCKTPFVARHATGGICWLCRRGAHTVREISFSWGIEAMHQARSLGKRPLHVPLED